MILSPPEEADDRKEKDRNRQGKAESPVLGFTRSKTDGGRRRQNPEQDCNKEIELVHGLNCCTRVDANRPKSCDKGPIRPKHESQEEDEKY